MSCCVCYIHKRLYAASSFYLCCTDAYLYHVTLSHCFLSSWSELLFMFILYNCSDIQHVSFPAPSHRNCIRINLNCSGKVNIFCWNNCGLICCSEATCCLTEWKATISSSWVTRRWLWLSWMPGARSRRQKHQRPGFKSRAPSVASLGNKSNLAKVKKSEIMLWIIQVNVVL